VQPNDQVRLFVSIRGGGVQVGQVDVVPEHGAVAPVVQQRGGDVLALLQRQVQALSL